MNAETKSKTIAEVEAEKKAVNNDIKLEKVNKKARKQVKNFVLLEYLEKSCKSKKEGTATANAKQFKKLAADIFQALEAGYSKKDIHTALVNNKQLDFSYSTFARFVTEFKPKTKKEKS